jgi:hypothetical protein
LTKAFGLPAVNSDLLLDFYLFIFESQDPANVHIKNSPWGELLFGGYSSHITVHEKFVLALADGMDIARTAPLLCAGE